MAQLSTKIKLYCEANDVSNVDFQKDPHIFASKYNFTKIDESLCLENTAIKFDGNNYHSSSSPTDSQYRITLNINVTKM